MKHAAFDLITSDLSEAELERRTARLVTQSGFRCGRVLSVLPTRTPDMWQVSCMADGAMDALVCYRMNARTGAVTPR